MWEILESLIIKKTNVVQLVGEYELEADRLSAIRSTKNGFSAVAVAALRSPPSKELSRDEIERIISNSNSPFRLVVQSERLDESKMLDNLKTRRSMKEMELARAKLNGKQEANTKIIAREIELIEAEIRSISSGETPLKVEIYLMSSSLSDSKFVAQEKVLAQIKGLSGEFSAVLGASFELVAGNELVKLLCFDSMYYHSD